MKLLLSSLIGLMAFANATVAQESRKPLTEAIGFAYGIAGVCPEHVPYSGKVLQVLRSVSLQWEDIRDGGEYYPSFKDGYAKANELFSSKDEACLAGYRLFGPRGEIIPEILD